MATFEIDDQACFNAKVIRAGNEAFGAWCRAGSWCMANLTDGYVTRDVARIIARDEVWYALRDCGLPKSGLVEERQDGWQIHDWDHWQRTASEILKHREQQAIRQRNRRALKRAQKGVTRDVQRDVPSDVTRDVQRESHSESRPPHPHPHPHPVKEIPSTTPTAPLTLTGDSDPEQKPRKKSKRASPLPAEWAPSQAHKELAAKEGRNVDREATKFRDHAAATGRKMLDWDAAFRTWLRSDIGRGQPAKQPTSGRNWLDTAKVYG